MNDTVIVIKGTVSEDGRLVVTLPPDTPRGDVEVVLRRIAATEADTALDETLEAVLNDPAMFSGSGQTMGEIVQSPAIGMWENRSDMLHPTQWLAERRRSSQERHLKRD